jgi:hypothetical protein
LRWSFSTSSRYGTRCSCPPFTTMSDKVSARSSRISATLSSAARSTCSPQEPPPCPSKDFASPRRKRSRARPWTRRLRETTAPVRFRPKSLSASSYRGHENDVREPLRRHLRRGSSAAEQVCVAHAGTFS